MKKNLKLLNGYFKVKPLNNGFKIQNLLNGYTYKGIYKLNGFDDDYYFFELI